MCSWRRVAVARVFALVVRCRIMRLLLYSRVGKNRDTRRESPAAAGAVCAASHITVLFSQKILAAQKGNCIYRPVRQRCHCLISNVTGIEIVDSTGLPSFKAGNQLSIKLITRKASESRSLFTPFKIVTSLGLPKESMTTFI